jgi:hypothetical protein
LAGFIVIWITIFAALEAKSARGIALERVAGSDL